MSQRFFVKSLINESGWPFTGKFEIGVGPKREADLEIYNNRFIYKLLKC